MVLVADMAGCMAKEGVGFCGRQGWTGGGGGGVWQWDSGSAPNRGSRGKLKVDEEEFERDNHHILNLSQFKLKVWLVKF